MTLFRANRVQVATYLLGICPSSIAFLVFLNSSVSFVITDLIGLRRGEGDAVGTLGFADELLALIACPVWGLLSDRIGLRTVCCLGYFIIALALVLFVQAKNVYPQLLLGRLFFSIGGAAASTMVTAILPAVVGMERIDTEQPSQIRSRSERACAVAASEASAADSASEYDGNERDEPNQESQPVDLFEDSSSQSTITPTRLKVQRDSRPQRPESTKNSQVEERAEQSQASKHAYSATIQPSSSKVAGFVGLATGVGALISLGVFLPLPARFQKAGISPSEALQDSYYVVAVVALVLSCLAFLGLRGLSGEDGKSFTRILRFSKVNAEEIHRSERDYPFWARFSEAFKLGLSDSRIGLGYVGGLVARASSVGISLFIPLAINAQFKQAGLCNIDSTDSPGGLPDLKRRCPRAYTLAAELTGVSQLIALIAAPAFGYLSSRFRRNYPLMFGAFVGIAGYIIFGIDVQSRRSSINGTVTEFVAMAFIGLSQIAAIVCSLGVLSDGIIIQGAKGSDADSSTLGGEALSGEEAPDEQLDERRDVGPERSNEADAPSELDLLLGNLHDKEKEQEFRLKGSVAGMYSFYGGAGILILTKAGGAMFDGLSFGCPFYIMAVFNAMLFVSSIYSAVATSNDVVIRRR